MARVEVTFRSGLLDPYLSGVIAGFRDTDAAKQSMAYVRSSLDCASWTSTVDGRQLTDVPSLLPFPTLGDDIFAVRISAYLGAMGTVGMDAVVVLIGCHVLLLSHWRLGGVDSAQTETFARIAVDKTRPLVYAREPSSTCARQIDARMHSPPSHRGVIL
jgi:hypothetical protein